MTSGLNNEEQEKLYYRIHKIAIKLKNYISGYPNVYVMLDDIELALASTRESTLEEAAKVADAHAISEMEGRAKYTVDCIEKVATAIRNLKSGGGR